MIDVGMNKPRLGSQPCQLKVSTTFAAVLLVAGMLAGCGKDATRAAESGGDSRNKDARGIGSAASDSQAQLFSVPADQMQHVQIVTVQPTSLPRILRLSGSVAFNAFRTTPVITQVSGPVARILVQPGEVVPRGKPMLYVSSPDYSQSRANYLKARDAFLLADKGYARSKDLYTHHAIAERDLQAAESQRTQAQADMIAAEQSLKILGVNNPEATAAKVTSPEIPLFAPLSGEVVERLVSPGQVVQAGSTQCFTISDMSTVWVLVNIFQDHLAYVHLGDPVTIQTDAYPTTFHGKISYIAEALDPTSRAVQARIVTDNPGRKLKKDMYVFAMVRAGNLQNAIAVPDSAVLRDSENEPFVYVGTDASGHQFGRRAVKLGESTDGVTQVVSGLKPGERVVGDGSLFLQFANSLQR